MQVEKKKKKKKKKLKQFVGSLFFKYLLIFLFYRIGVILCLLPPVESEASAAELGEVDVLVAVAVRAQNIFPQV